MNSKSHNMTQIVFSLVSGASKFKSTKLSSTPTLSPQHFARPFSKVRCRLRDRLSLGSAHTILWSSVTFPRTRRQIRVISDCYRVYALSQPYMNPAPNKALTHLQYNQFTPTIYLGAPFHAACVLAHLPSVLGVFIIGISSD